MQSESVLTTLYKEGIAKSFPLRTVGYVLIAESILMFLCTVLFGLTDENLGKYILCSVAGAVVGALLIVLFKQPSTVTAATGVFTVNFLWAAAIMYGSLPYVIYGFNVPDSIFESISGFTTTGMSIVTNVAALDNSILVWRAATGWAGGIGFIIMFCLMLKFFSLNGRNLFVSDGLNMTTVTSSKSLKMLAIHFIVVYALLTSLLAIILMILGNPAIDSLCISLSTISTTGFSTLNDNLMGMSMASKITLGVFLMISAMNFLTLFSAVIGRNPKKLLKDTEIKHMFCWFLGASFVLVVILGQANALELNLTDIVDTILMVISIGTTTGFLFHDFTWPTVAMLFLCIIALIGGCRESPTGGVKVSRLSLVFRSLRGAISTVGFPNEVRSVKFGGTYVKDSICYSAMMTMLIFLSTAALGTLAIGLTGVDTLDSFYLCVSSLTTTGTGLYSVTNMASIPTAAQGIMCALMWLGRMEITLVLVMFTPTFWKELRVTVMNSVYDVAAKFRKT